MMNPCFLRLIQSLKGNLTKKKKTTVFIGAGCSLTSSTKNITTYGIVHSLVKQFAIDVPITEDWKNLYETFVNIVWSNQGTEDRIQLLEDYFEGMSPSVGYKNLRWLLEAGYINNIITTNFDLMIDQALDGLSYRLIVGSIEEMVGDAPAQFTVIKAHGDLRHGQLRFAPGELSKLPDKLAQEIRKITQHTVIVIGYRGQDIGILNALYDTNTHNAYWISLEKPDQLNLFENEGIYSWMKARNSMNNFLYGKEFGCFDNILIKIKNTLIQLKDKEENSKKDFLQKMWRQSIIFDYFHLNKRFLDLFEKLYHYLDKEVSTSLWKITGPFYAPSFEKLMQSALTLLNKNEILPPYYCIENEVDALIFSLSCSIWLTSQGYPYTSSELLNTIKKEFEKDEPEIIISPDFWTVIELLSNPEMWRQKSCCSITSVSFCFNQSRDFSVVLKDINLYNMHQLIDIMECLLLFMETSDGQTCKHLVAQNKQILEKHLCEIRNNDNRIVLKMYAIPLDCYQNLYLSLLKGYFTEHLIGDRFTLYHDPIYVDFTIAGSRLNRNINIWESLVEKATESKKNFIKNFTPEQYVERTFTDIIVHFLESDNNGLFIVGESGCGKTVALKQWTQQLKPEKYLIYPISGREQDGSLELGEGYFDSMLYDKNKLGHLQIMLEQRQQTLLLIFDALNEIQGKFAYVISNYGALLNFCDTLTSQHIKNIRLIITCRRDSYQQLKRSSNFSPSNRSFFSVMINNEVSTEYPMPYFEKDEIEAFIKLYFNTENDFNYTTLAKEFGNLIFLPINLRMICDILKNSHTSNNFVNKEFVFEKWFLNLQNIGKEDGLSPDVINKILDYNIQYKYFSNNSAGLKTHTLSAMLKGNFSNVLAVYEWLTVHGVYEKNVSVPNLVQFSHDNIEEFFLTRYIEKNYSTQLFNIDTFLFEEMLELSIVEHALQNVFYHTFETDKLEFINLFVNVIRKNSSTLLSVCIQIYFEIAAVNDDQGYNLLWTINQYLLQKDFQMLVETMLSVAKQKLDVIDNLNLSGIKVINRIIASTNCRQNHSLYALGLYLEAKGQYVLASENETDKYISAYIKCEQAENYITEGSPCELVDDIHILKALLLRIQGHLNEAIQQMKNCYSRQIEFGLYNAACQSALNLGAMYREMTQFDKALELYGSIDVNMVTDETIVYRLYMNIGIIYKNKVQNALFSREKNIDENINLYKTALTHFDKTCKFAEEQDNVPLRLEIYAELVECTCVGYYLNLTTIEEAVSWVNKMDDIIGRYPIPVERIQNLRMRSRVLVLKCEFSEALKCLEIGYNIAVSYKLQLLATDCCNLITGIISDNLNNDTFINDEILQKGMEYGKYAINYYNQLKNTNHRYLQDSILKYNRIKEIYDKF